MNLHEYQAKEILNSFGVRIQRGYVATSAEEAVNKAKKISLNRFIYSIGIRHIGQENAKILARYYKSANKFKDIFNSDRYWRIMRYLASPNFDAQTMMGTLPIQHYVSEALDNH